MRESVEKRLAEERKAAKPTLAKRPKLAKKPLLLTAGFIATAATIGLVGWVLLQTASHVSRLSVDSSVPRYDLPKTSTVNDKAALPRLAVGMTEPAGFSSKVVAPAPTSSADVPSNCNPATAHVNPLSPDVVINKKHCLVPIDFTPALATISCSGTAGYLQSQAASAFQLLCNDAAAAGLPIVITSSFRSYSNQVTTYNYWVSINGSVAAADRVSARPGFSEHQTGLVLDLATSGCSLECFGGTAQYRWMQTNAARYGFIQRYYPGYESITGYSAEPWHYRYVGAAVASDMKASGVKTLEQYYGVTGGDYR